MKSYHNIGKNIHQIGSNVKANLRNPYWTASLIISVVILGILAFTYPGTLGNSRLETQCKHQYGSVYDLCVQYVTECKKTVTFARPELPACFGKFRTECYTPRQKVSYSPDVKYDCVYNKSFF